MTAPLPDRIAAAIDNYRARCRTLDEADCYGSMDRASYDEQRKGVLDARDALNAEVVAERDAQRECFNLLSQRCHAAERKVDSLIEQRDAERARADGLAADVRDLTDILHRNGFRRCDAMACNCNSWHHVDGFAARFREIDEAVGEHNGKTLLCAVEEKLANLDQCVREREALAKSYRETVDQRDELLRAAIKVSNTSPRTSSSNERDLDHYDACTELGIVIERIARAQSGQPAHHDECACEDCLQRDDEQPPIQQPAAGEPTIQSGECSFLGQLPKGPALGRFSAAERAELDDLKRKAFKAGEP